MEREINGFIKLYDFMIEELEVNLSARVVYALIYGFCESGGECNASRAYISRRLGISLSTVDRAVSDLVSADLIEVKRRDGTILYSINKDAARAARLRRLASVADERGGFGISKNAGGDKPLISILHLGESGEVRMTPAQYSDLVTLVGEEELERYIIKLDYFITTRLPVEPGSFMHSHYKTLREWITEDFGKA